MNLWGFDLNVSKTVALLATVIVLQLLWCRRHLYYVSWKLPGPLALPFIGNLLNLSRDRLEMFQIWKVLFEKYGTLFRVWLGPQLLILISHPDDIQVIAHSENSFEKPFVYKFAYDWTGNGIFAAPRDVWKHTRKIMTQSFTPPMMDNYMKVFNEQSQVFVDIIQEHANTNEYFGIFEYANRFTLDVACEIILGIKLKSQMKNTETGEYDNEYARATDTALWCIFQRSTKPWLTPNFIYRFSSLARKFDECCRIFNGLSETVIKNTQLEYKLSLLNNNEQKPKTVIQMLVSNNAPNRLTSRHMRDELNTMIAAGSDTSGHMLGFVFLLLAMFPDVQEKLFRELEKNAAGENLTKESLCELPYLDQVIKETLRLFPLITVIARDVTDDVKLKSQDITLKKGTVAVMDIHAVHRNPEIWGNDAHEFNPDRFSPENSSNRHPYSYMAFSAGPRNCIGLKFGKNSVKVLVAHTVQKYKLTTDEKFEDIQCEFNVLLKKTGGWKVKLFDR